jgi:hypothetical protein
MVLEWRSGLKVNTFLINFNLLTWPKQMVEYLLDIPEIVPIILDNNSTYLPLLEWYDKNCPVRVIRFDKNWGHHVGWDTGVIFDLFDGHNPYYILSDPDLDLTNIPKDFLNVLISGFEKYHDCTKCGFGIKIDDLPKESPVYDLVPQWETRFWEKPLDDLYYDATLDTTFAVHSVERDHTGTIGVRTGPPYITRHLPFYLTKENLTDEIRYYFDHVEWYSTIGRIFKERGLV